VTTATITSGLGFLLKKRETQVNDINNVTFTWRVKESRGKKQCVMGGPPAV